MERLHEKCAVVGVSSDDKNLDASRLAYEMLLSLQHRGQEASGIAVEDENGAINFVRGSGYVRDVFRSGESLVDLDSSRAIGHNRYSTNGSKYAHQQPVIDRPLRFGFAHNGNLPSTSVLSKYLADHNISSSGLNDSEMMAYAISSKLRSGSTVREAIETSTAIFTGAYACTILYQDSIVAFRDPKGIRPLSMGRTGDTILFASETCALDSVDAKDITDVNPGECVIARGTKLERFQFAKPDPKLDIFEIVYFARPDSRLYGRTVASIRRNFGEKLAQEHPPRFGSNEDIIVVPVPDTSIPAAEGYADRLGLRHSQGIVKDRYTASGRSFIAGNNKERQSMLRRKHTFLSNVVDGKHVIIIDDSLVRGNTLPRLVNEARKKGAKTVSCLIASPPVRFPDFYGIDTPSQAELLASRMSVDDMKKFTKCDYLGFLSLDGMVGATGKQATDFTVSAFTGEYPIDIGENSKDISEPISMEFIH